MVQPKQRAQPCPRGWMTSYIEESFPPRIYFKAEGTVLREEIVIFTRNLLKIAHSPSLLEGYTSCRLIPLDKNPGIRPTGVGEVLRRIVGKNCFWIFEGRSKRQRAPFRFAQAIAQTQRP